MNIVFLQAKKPLVKEITKNGTKPYPLVKNFTSTEETITVDKKGLIKLFRALCSAAANGMCMLKGPLKRPLVDERLNNALNAFCAERQSVLFERHLDRV